MEGTLCPREYGGRLVVSSGEGMFQLKEVTQIENWAPRCQLDHSLSLHGVPKPEVGGGDVTRIPDIGQGNLLHDTVDSSDCTMAWIKSSTTFTCFGFISVPI